MKRLHEEITMLTVPYQLAAVKRLLKGEITMIEVKITPKGEGHDVMVAVNGNFKELVAEGLLAIGTICESIREYGPLEAAIFNDILLKAVQDKASPIWNLQGANHTKIIFAPPVNRE